MRINKVLLLQFLFAVQFLPFYAQEENKFQEDACGTEDTLCIQNGSRSVFGIISRPVNGKGRQPVAIIAHGFNGTHHFGMNYFEPLNNIGYQCYAFDFPCGSVHSRSDAHTVNMSVLDEMKDLEAVVRHFKSQPDVDPDRIVLIGESQGGLVSSLVASEMRKEISRLVLVYPALCIPDNWNGRYPELTDIPDTTFLWNVPIGKRFFTELRDMDVFGRIGAFRRPVLIVHGDADNIVPVDYAYRAMKVYRHAKLHVIPGAGHGFKAEEFEEAVRQIRLFLEEDKSGK